MKNLFTSLLIFTFSFLLMSCGDSEDKKTISSNIQNMREAIQNHNKNDFMKYVAPRYSGQSHGNRASLERFVINQLKSNKNIYIYIADTSIEISDGIANVVFYAGTAGGPDQVPERGQLFKVQTTWRAYGGHWQLTNARWRPALIK